MLYFSKKSRNAHLAACQCTRELPRAFVLFLGLRGSAGIASSICFVSRGCVDFRILKERLGMFFVFVICSSSSVSFCVSSNGQVADGNSQLVSSMLLAICSQSASLKCYTSLSCDAVSGILMFDLGQHAFVVRHRRTWLRCAIRRVGKHKV